MDGINGRRKYWSLEDIINTKKKRFFKDYKNIIEL